MRWIALLLVFMTGFSGADAQETGGGDNSFIVKLLEDQLSTENRQIRLIGINGLLSSDAQVAEITIADAQGVWLRIVNATISWHRTQLMIGQLNIDRLAAERIIISRRPNPAPPGLPKPEATRFKLPDLPFAVNLSRLEIGSLEVGASVFGLETRVSATGALALAKGKLDASLDVSDLTGAGGRLLLTTAFSDETGVLDVDVRLDEPQNGVLANLLNLPGKPPVALRVKGAGPLGNLDLGMTLDLAGQRIADGTATFRGTNDDLVKFDLALAARMQGIVPPEIAAFFGERSTLTASGSTRAGGGFRIGSFSVTGSALDVAGALTVSGDGFLEGLEISSRLGGKGGKTPLPIGRGRISVSEATFDLAYGIAGAENWNGRFVARGFKTPELSIGRIDLSVDGIARNLSDPAKRTITFRTAGAADAIASPRPEIAAALGRRVDLSAEGAWSAGTPIIVRAARIAGENLEITADGNIRGVVLDGNFHIATNSIAPFSRMADRNLSGALMLAAKGTYEPLSGIFDLMLDGTADDLRLDQARLDPLLAGHTILRGRIARSEAGFTTDGFRLSNEQVEFMSSGTIRSTGVDLKVSAALADVNLITNRATGQLRLSGLAASENGRTAFDIRMGIPVGSVLKRPLVAAGLSFSGTYESGQLLGHLSGVGNLESFPVQISGDLKSSDAGKSVSNLVFRTEGAVLTGAIEQTGDGLFAGKIDYDASDISKAAALLLQDAEGAIRGHVSFGNEGGRQNVDAVADVSNLAFRSVELADGHIKVKVRDTFGVPKISGTASAVTALIAGVSVDDFTAQAVNQGSATLFRANAVLQNGTNIHTEGLVDEADNGFQIDLTALDLKQGDLSAGLAYPALIGFSKGEIRVETLAMKVGDGEIRASGVVSDTYGLAITLDSVPLSLANAVRPDLGLEGTVSGNGAMYGLRSAPNVFLDLHGSELSSSLLRDAGLAAFSLDTTIGSNQKNGVDVNASIASADGVKAVVTGEIPFGGAEMTLDVELEKFPLAFIDRRIGNRGLRGEVTGRTHITGTVSNPSATFALTAADVALREVRMAQLAPLKADVKGSYIGKSFRLEKGRVTGPRGLAVDLSGYLAVPSGRLDIKLNGAVPLSAIIPLYFRRGLTAEGLAKTDLTIRGPFDHPRLSGSLATTGAVITDPPTNMRVKQIAMQLQLRDNRVSIVQANGQFSGGGKINVAGGMDFDIPSGLPADLQISLQNVTYSNRRFLTTRFDAELELKGPLARGPLLSGDVALKNTELSIAGRFGNSVDLLHVTHRHAPKSVRTTDRMVRKVNSDGAAHKAPYPVQLDLAITSKNRVFVRGRGVDAELGGKLKVSGPIDDYIPEGGFQLVRGRINILALKLTLDEGQVTLLGDLDPEVLFIANASSSDLSATIRLSGRISDPVLEITSSPELPEDEIIARLVFDRSVGDLSPIQLARVANAVAELSGGSDNSIFGSLRRATGLDDLDISADQKGNAVVKAGKYVDSNVYLGLEAGSEGSSRATINLDLTNNMRARGSVDSEGESSIGLFFERDY